MRLYIYRMGLDNLGNIALLVLDIQNDFCHEKGIFSKLGMDVKPAQEMVPRLINFIDKIRHYNIPIFYSKQIESDDVSPQNLKNQFKTGRLKAVCAPNSWGSELYKLKPLSKEQILEKHAYDFLSNTVLRKLLKEKQIDTVILSGINTDVCIDTTLRSAFTLGYNILIPEDIVASMNREAHKHLLKIFHHFFGAVVKSDDILEFLGRKT